MAKKAEYRIITGQQPQIQAELNSAGDMGWKPILMSTAGVPSAGVVIVVILEHILGGVTRE